MADRVGWARADWTDFWRSMDTETDRQMQKKGLVKKKISDADRLKTLEDRVEFLGQGIALSAETVLEIKKGWAEMEKILAPFSTYIVSSTMKLNSLELLLSQTRGVMATQGARISELESQKKGPSPWSERLDIVESRLDHIYTAFADDLDGESENTHPKECRCSTCDDLSSHPDACRCARCDESLDHAPGCRCDDCDGPENHPGNCYCLDCRDDV